MTKINTLEDIYLVSKRVHSVSPDEIRSAEKTLGCRFPEGYSDIMTQFGAGTFSNLIKIHAPSDVLERLEEYRKFLAARKWTNDGMCLEGDKLASIVCFASTTSDEAIGFLPGKEQVIYKFKVRFEQSGPTLIDCLNHSLSPARSGLAYYEPKREIASVTFEGPRAFDSFDKAECFFKKHFQIDRHQRVAETSVFLYSQASGATFFYYNDASHYPDDCEIAVEFDPPFADAILPVVSSLFTEDCELTEFEGLSEDLLKKYSLS